MKAKILLLLLLVTDIIIEVNAQTITSDITVCFYESDTLTPLFANQDSIHVSVEEILSISDWSWDSIELSLEKPHWLAPLMPHMFFSDIQVFTRKSPKDNWEQIHYEYLFPIINHLSKIIGSPSIELKSNCFLVFSDLFKYYNDSYMIFYEPMMDIAIKGMDALNKLDMLELTEEDKSEYYDKLSSKIIEFISNVIKQLKIKNDSGKLNPYIENIFKFLNMVGFNETYEITEENLFLCSGIIFDICSLCESSIASFVDDKFTSDEELLKSVKSFYSDKIEILGR